MKLNNAEKIALGGIEVELDGENHIVFYNWAAINALEEEIAKRGIGKSVEVLDYGTIGSFVIVMWAGLLHEGNELTIDDVGEMFYNSVGGGDGEMLIKLTAYKFAMKLAITKATPKERKEAAPLIKAVIPKAKRSVIKAIAKSRSKR